MKFAHYLSEAQTPEWKKAYMYIDYRALKKRISAIRSEEQNVQTSTVPNALTRSSGGEFERASSLRLSVEDQQAPPTQKGSPGKTDAAPQTQAQGPSSQKHHRRTISISLAGQPDRQPKVSVDKIPAFVRKWSFASFARSSQNEQIPLQDLILSIPPRHRKFFQALDAQLAKIESFYLDREKEMRVRGDLIMEQIRELGVHQHLWKATHPTEDPRSRTARLKASLLVGIPASLKRRQAVESKSSDGEAAAVTDGNDEKPFSALGEATGFLDPSSHTARLRASASVALSSSIQRPQTAEIKFNDGDACVNNEENGKPASGSDSVSHAARLRASVPVGLYSSFKRPPTAESQISDGGTCAHTEEKGKQPFSAPAVDTAGSLDPDDYFHAKRKLKKAVLEHYRGLAMLNNYRILNMEGIRKVLKKFEKVTKIAAQDAYMSEKVQLSAFASETSVKTMMKEMEDAFALCFSQGDKKRALKRLRAAPYHKTHHFSTFRSGMLLGISLPPLIAGIYQSFRPDTRAAIPAWDGLLYVYAVFCMPVVFSLLVGLNLLVWSQSRINYPFIFDGRTRLDYREYFEIPAALLSTLCYAFWLSFSRVGAHKISPTTWPLIWIGVMVCIMVNPLPIFFKSSRFWLQRNIGRLLLPGVHRVEFTDFWLGDQFCSLVFSLANLYIISCAYARGFDRTWSQCSATAQDWAVPFALASLPLFIRMIQSIRRYADSKLITHLINGGKYAAGISTYLLYFLWRHLSVHSSPGRGASFILWCLFSSVYSTYASSWDLIMDWSVLRIRAEHPLLRSELIYSYYVPLYYVAIVTNVLIRFIWVIYIPARGPTLPIRAFIAAMLEILRRWQWNFYRLENEHLGNMDQYRVTREVPLPYHIDETGHEDDDDEEAVKGGTGSHGWVKRRQRIREKRSWEDDDDSSPI